MRHNVIFMIHSLLIVRRKRYFLFEGYEKPLQHIYKINQLIYT
ncbi:conserved domain protein [Phocaeicola vulgatus PC510]|uniref:Conserved domain protein n=1 Tax=Phocaeicola vulgatus PC510 TaxID=702446 RepID=D4VBD7_PHOVU|nr:conserved domain protein [Phocaeicola vulgatus PC510]